MKIHLLFFQFLMILLFVVSCKNDKPKTQEAHFGEMPSPVNEAVLQAFKQRFPTAENVVFDTINGGVEISFVENNLEHTAFFDKNGTFMYLSTYIEQDKLPAAAQDLLDKIYPEATINIINAVEDSADKHYFVELVTEDAAVVLEFDKDGKLLKNTKRPLSLEEIQAREEEGVDNNSN